MKIWIKWWKGAWRVWYYYVDEVHQIGIHWRHFQSPFTFQEAWFLKKYEDQIDYWFLKEFAANR